MENKNQNLLLLALAGFGIFYFLKNKNVPAPVVPPTTGGGNDFSMPPQRPREIVKPVEPVYQAPIFDERDPIYQEPINNVPRVDVPPPAIVEAPIYDYVQPPTTIWDEPIINEPIYYAPIVDVPVQYTPETGKIDVPTPGIVQTPIYDYVTPVEPVYNEPIYQAPIYQPEPIYDEPIYQEPSPVYNNNVEYGGSVIDFANNVPFIELYKVDEPIEYDFELKRR